MITSEMSKGQDSWSSTPDQLGPSDGWPFYRPIVGGGWFEKKKAPIGRARRRCEPVEIKANIQERFLQHKMLQNFTRLPRAENAQISGVIMTKKAPLTLVQGPIATLPEPPSSLGEAGLALWRSIQAQYGICDAGGLAILEQACGATDRITEYRTIINQQGAVIVTKSGIKEHPLVKHETAQRALVGRLISRLGLDIEALRPTPGRPPQGFGWVPPER